MRILIPLIAVLVLIVLGAVGGGSARYLFFVVLPYAGLAIFVLGIVYRVIHWARSPVPFRIPTSCGQQKSLPWIRSNNPENPHNMLGVIWRMILEVLFFRSLFRNTTTEIRQGPPRVLHSPDKWLWASSLLFHWSLLIILVRHFKYFVEPIPDWIIGLQNLDGFFQIGLPVLLLTDIVVVAALSYLVLRRLWEAKLRYISLPADYFALFLLLGITGSGIYLRYFDKSDITAAKQLGTGLLSFSPFVPEGLGATFGVHLFLVSILLAYIPLSKLVHMAGVFMSPTRNMVNNNRRERHVNPWDYPVKVHTYEEYEDEFRDVMKAAELPVEKD